LFTTLDKKDIQSCEKLRGLTQKWLMALLFKKSRCFCKKPGFFYGERQIMFLRPTDNFILAGEKLTMTITMDRS
jgi:hypothetical protein